MSKSICTLVMMFAVAWTEGSRAAEPSLDDLKARLASLDYETRKSAVTDLLYTGQKRPLSEQEINLLLPHLKSDSDWRIKVRITSVLPSAQNPEWVLTPLLDALQDRQSESSGEGNVPGYACKNLARLGNARALTPMREWLEYLESHPDIYPMARDDEIKQAKRWISELETKLKDKGSNESVEPSPTP